MTGAEWVLEAYGCNAAALADPARLRTLFERIIAGLQLHPVGEPLWHQFPGSGGITGLCLLSESHLACHTFPEYRSLCLNVFCCRERGEWDFEFHLRELVAADHVSIRRLERPYGAALAEGAA
jgi:S-adenosylmethionine decarboxylase